MNNRCKENSVKDIYSRSQKSALSPLREPAYCARANPNTSIEHSSLFVQRDKYKLRQTLCTNLYNTAT
jgi:hypothetical protein